MNVFIISLIFAIAGLIAAHPRGTILSAVISLIVTGYLVGTPTVVGDGLWWQYLLAPAASVFGAVIGELTFPDPIEYQMKRFREIREQMEQDDEYLDGYQ